MVMGTGSQVTLLERLAASAAWNAHGGACRVCGDAVEQLRLTAAQLNDTCGLLQDIADYLRFIPRPDNRRDTCDCDVCAPAVALLGRIDEALGQMALMDEGRRVAGES